MRIATLDIATRTGVAVGVVGERPEWHLWRLKKPDDDTTVVADTMGRKIVELCLLEAYRPDLIVYEAPLRPFSQGQENGKQRERKIVRSAASIELPLYAIGALWGVARRYGIEVMMTTPAKARKHFIGTSNLGNGEATKAAVISRCITLGYVPPGFKDDNVCDALALWDWACATRGRHIPRELIMHGERPSAA